MPKLENKQISEVYEGKGGVTNGKPWKFYNFKLTGGTFKYDLLWGKGKPVPTAGDIVTFEFTTEVKGEYTNNKVGKIEVVTSAPKSSPEAQNGTYNQQQGKKVYMDHGKCVIELMKMCGSDPAILKELINTFMGGLDQMTGTGAQVKENPKNEDWSEKEPPPPGDEGGDIPF